VLHHAARCHPCLSIGSLHVAARHWQNQHHRRLTVANLGIFCGPVVVGWVVVAGVTVTLLPALAAAESPLFSSCFLRRAAAASMICRHTASHAHMTGRQPLIVTKADSCQAALHPSIQAAFRVETGKPARSNAPRLTPHTTHRAETRHGLLCCT
jgi:hypothetical protein